MKYIRWFNTLTMSDVPAVGGKNASLGEMIKTFTDRGLRIPNGFAVTVDAYWDFLKFNGLTERLQEIIAPLQDVNDIALLRSIGASLRETIESGTLPDDMAREIIESYQALSKQYNVDRCDVAVRSSATAEDLPEASFAGQQETFLNVHDDATLLKKTVACFASLFTDRAIIYRIEKGFDHFDIGISVGVQKMIRSDSACSGVMFTLDTETGFKDMVMIEASYGLGESIVKGTVTPDEYCVFKPMLKAGFKPIVRKKLGTKEIKLVYQADGSGTLTKDVSQRDQHQFCLKDEAILELARAGTIIEDHYSQLHGSWLPMDIEWAQDGYDKQLYIIQARPETVHASPQKDAVITHYTLQKSDDIQPVVQGEAIGQKIVSGTVRVVHSINDIDVFNQGDILVTQMTDPDWVPIMKRAAAIITDRGGRTCHAAIVSRELGIPALVGTHAATDRLHDGDDITVDCAQGKTGYVYKGRIPFESQNIEIDSLPQFPVDIMVNTADPDRAMVHSQLPVMGVGLARTEFIMAHMIRIHPMAACDPEKIKDDAIRSKIDTICAPYSDPQSYVVDVLAHGIGMIAASFYPRPVIVRTSDFKSNEYRNLIGGIYYEPEEANPMIGLRGASRYYNQLYAPAFALECAALRKVRADMGLDNLQVMIPFVRTVDEARSITQTLQAHGLQRGDADLKVIMMCEVPSNVIMIEQFLEHFDGISIGSNDLTQLTLAVDRDSEYLAPLFDERDPAVMATMKYAVEGARSAGKYSGICGQAPSDYPEIAQFLIDCGIDSISLSPDSVMNFIYSLPRQ